MEHTQRPARLNILGQPVEPALPTPAPLTSLPDYEQQARQHIEASAWQHIQGGADQQHTLAHNRAAFDALRLLPQPLADLSAAHTLELVQRAENAGYEAIVWTVDASIKRSGFALPAGVQAANLRHIAPRPQASSIDGPPLFGTPLVQQAPRWDELRWLRAHTRLPLIVKGVLHPAQARQLVDAGVDALIVSNHGGRVLDGVVSPLEVLPAIAQAVHVPLLLDSGVRWGTDVVKALALGASAVLVGRPQLHALACAGWLGVAHMLHLLRSELELAMAQLGCATLADIGPGILWKNS